LVVIRISLSENRRLAIAPQTPALRLWLVSQTPRTPAERLVQLPQRIQLQEVLMHGPPLTRLELAAVLRAQVVRLVARHIDRSTAINAVAVEHGIDPEWVAELVASADALAGGEA
jgi:hypothetical protein